MTRPAWPSRSRKEKEASPISSPSTTIGPPLCPPCLLVKGAQERELQPSLSLLFLALSLLPRPLISLENMISPLLNTHSLICDHLTLPIFLRHAPISCVQMAPKRHLQSQCQTRHHRSCWKPHMVATGLKLLCHCSGWS